MMRTLSWTNIAVLAAATFTLAATPAIAGIPDTALPVLPGVGAAGSTVYTLTGLRNDATSAVVIHCANADDETVDVGVEFFDYNGTALNDVAAGNGTWTIGVGSNRTFATTSIAAYFVDENITLSSDMNQGSARISATSKKLLCHALMVDPSNSPPAFTINLPIFSKAKQKGE